MPRSLFRKEAIDAQREKFLGEAGIAQPVRLWVYTATAGAIAVLVVAVAVWGQYTRRERVQGVLSSAVGAALVRMPDAGTVAEIMVKEGDAVARGAALARLTVDRSGTNDERSNAAVVEQLQRRKTSAGGEKQQTTDLGRQEVQQLRVHAADLQKQLGELDAQVRLQTERYESQRVIAARWKALEDERFVSDIRVRQEQDKAKEEEIRVQELRGTRSRLATQLSDALAAVPAAETRNRTRLQQIDQQLAEIDQAIEQQSLTQGDRKRDMLITAPIDGTVTNIGPVRGQTVAADAPLATLLPKDSPLHAELLVPTRAIGFVHPGQQVNLRYEAFPYERFGQYRGAVESVGRTILMQGDAIGPLAIHEPVYRIVVALDRQDIAAGGERLPLRAGMVVGADLLMERRTLIEWLFQPILQLRQRIGNADSPTNAAAS